MRLKMLPLLAAVVGVIMFTGCTKILLRPAIDNVKTVAVVSVYMNRDFYNIKAPKADESKAALKTLGRALMKETGVLNKIDTTFNAQFLQIVSYAVKKYSETLEGLGPFHVEPMENVLRNSSYQNFISEAAKDQPFPALASIGAAIKSADWYTPPNMIHIPADMVVEDAGKHTTYFGKTKDPRAEFRKELANLCKSLNVDALAIVQLDMAYKKAFISINLGEGSAAAPRVASSVFVVNKDGEVAVNTGLFGKGEGEYVEGDNAPMIRGDMVHLNDKSVSSYCGAIDKAGSAMRKKLEKAFAKLK
jgi:hypothetical protein